VSVKYIAEKKTNIAELMYGAKLEV